MSAPFIIWLNESPSVRVVLSSVEILNGFEKLEYHKIKFFHHAYACLNGLLACIDKPTTSHNYRCRTCDTCVNLGVDHRISVLVAPHSATGFCLNLMRVIIEYCIHRKQASVKNFTSIGLWIVY